MDFNANPIDLFVVTKLVYVAILKLTSLSSGPAVALSRQLLICFPSIFFVTLF